MPTAALGLVALLVSQKYCDLIQVVWKPPRWIENADASTRRRNGGCSVRHPNTKGTSGHNAVTSFAYTLWVSLVLLPCTSIALTRVVDLRLTNLKGDHHPAVMHDIDGAAVGT